MNFSKEELYDLITPTGGRYGVVNDDEAFLFCREMTISHYENFPVASVLIPKRLRKFIFAIYSFARIADDIADELNNEPPHERIHALNQLGTLITDISNNASNPILRALKITNELLYIPAKPYLDLLHAFITDVNFVQPADMAALENYCKYSANPVGELVLRVFGQYSDENKYFSDKICTGLQMVNFWQDLSRDIPNGRIYLPEENMKKHSISLIDLHELKNKVKLIFFLNEIFDYTQQFFFEGKNLVNRLKSFRLKTEIASTIEGGLLVLNKCRASKEMIFLNRPRINKSNILQLAASVLVKHRLV